MIVFVGSNPSNAAENLAPFTPETKSGKVLQQWITMAGITEYMQANIADIKTPNNRPLTKTEIKINIPRIKSTLSGFTKIVALGKTAHEALIMAGIPHLELLHPSGLNRKLNNPKCVEECIDKLREYAK